MIVREWIQRHSEEGSETMSTDSEKILRDV